MPKTLIQGLDLREWNILSGFLYMGALFGRDHGIDNFDFVVFVPNVEHRRQIMKEYHEWNGDIGAFNPLDTYEWEHAFMLAAFYAQKKLHSPQRLEAWEFPLVAGLLVHESNSFAWRATTLSSKMSENMMELAMTIWPEIVRLREEEACNG